MKEPMRLRDEGATALERALLDAGSAYRGSPSARAKTLGTLGLAGSAGLFAAATARAPLASAGKLSLGKLSLTKFLAGAAICGAVAAVPGYRAWNAHHGSGYAGRAVTSPIPVPPRTEPIVTQLGTGTAVAEAPAPSVAAPAVAAPLPGPVAHRRAAGDATVPLSRELASIDAARTALARGDAAGAIARLNRYARAYPRGRLDMEAEVLRIDALVESGRTDQARARAREFLRRHPNSVLGAHVRTRLGD
ncbi:MAG TPA: hypothetical protein VN962_26285 [Polyangia bacterium]|nr:hypothetical protein [Polyangia bacterium]